MAGLTAREKQVVVLLAQGKTTQQIADSLCVQRVTIYQYTQRIREKTGAATTLELAVKAAQNISS